MRGGKGIEKGTLVNQNLLHLNVPVVPRHDMHARVEIDSNNAGLAGYGIP